MQPSWRKVDTGSGAVHAAEDRETSGQNVGQVLPIRRRLPVLAKRNEWHVFSELLLQIATDPLLLLQIGRFEPGGAQLFDTRTVAQPVINYLPSVG
jgi:hypothetical protein